MIRGVRRESGHDLRDRTISVSRKRVTRAKLLRKFQGRPEKGGEGEEMGSLADGDGRRGGSSMDRGCCRGCSGKRRAHLEILRNGLRKLLESAEYKSFPTAVIRFSRVFGGSSGGASPPLFCLIARRGSNGVTDRHSVCIHLVVGKARGRCQANGGRFS